MDATQTLTTAQSVLEHRHGHPVILAEPEALPSQHTVLRAAVRQGEGLPASVVIKQLPPDARFGAGKRLLSEWAGLEFTASLSGETAFAPRFLGGDTDELLIILEDLGDAPVLNQVLHRGTRTEALEALADYGAFLGAFHAASAGREAEFSAIQKRLGAEAPPNDSSIDPRERLDEICELYAPLTDDLEALVAEITAASTAMHDDHPFRSFQHHDAGPHNVLMTPQGPRFVDFEFAQFDNCLLDMTALRLGFPPFGEGHLLPDDAVGAFENAYRSAASSRFPEMGDEVFYQLTIEKACVQWIVSKTAGLGEQFHTLLVRNDLGENPDPERVERVREYRSLVFTWITAYLNCFGESSRLPYTRDLVRRLDAEIRRYNPDVAARGRYGAFSP